MSWLSKAVKSVVGEKTYNTVKKVTSYAFPVAAIANIPKDFVSSGAASFYAPIAAAGVGASYTSGLFSSASASAPVTTPQQPTTGYNFGDLFSQLLKTPTSPAPSSGGGGFYSEGSAAAPSPSFFSTNLPLILGGVGLLVLILVLITRRR